MFNVSAGHAGPGEELESSVPFMWPSPSARENGETVTKEALEPAKKKEVIKNL